MTKTKRILNTLNNCIEELCRSPQNFLADPEKDFTRRRKLCLEKVIRILLSMQNKSLSHELLDLFEFDTSTPTASAFVQQRSKIKASAFEHIFKSFTNAADIKYETYRGFRLLAVDGSDVTFAANSDDPDSFFENNGAKSYSMLHLNAMYDLLNHIYTDAIIQKRRKENEHSAFVAMVDRADDMSSKVIVMADRGYESHNNMAHIQEKGWHFLLRIRDCQCSMLSKLNLSDEEFDAEFTLHLTRKQTNAMKELAKSDPTYKIIPSGHVFDYLPVKNKKSVEVPPYELKIRFVRFKISDDSYEVIATNLDKDEFPPYELKKLYAMRWGIETSFRDLKYTVGLVNFHAKKVEYIYQEIFARLIMCNFSELITSHVVIQQKDRKYCYKANFSETVQICRNFFLGKISPPNVETLIARYLTPIRPGRQRARCLHPKGAVSFVYRIA